MAFEQCCGLSRSGERCLRYAKNGVYCVHHDPEREAEREVWRQRVREGTRKSWSERRADVVEAMRELMERTV